MLAQLAQLRHSCEAFRTGELRVLGVGWRTAFLHYQRIGKTETAEIIVNRSGAHHRGAAGLAKHTEVNPMALPLWWRKRP